MEDSLPRVLLLMVQKSGDHQMRLLVSPIIYMVLCPSKRWLVGCLGYLLPSTVVTQVILTISSFAKFHHSNNPPPPANGPPQPPNVVSRLKLVKKPEVLLEMPADTVVEAADPGSEDRARLVGGEKCWNTKVRYRYLEQSSHPWWVLWEVEPYAGWWFYSNIFYVHPYFLGQMIQFDGHIFQRGWFNHQLDMFWKHFWKNGLVIAWGNPVWTIGPCQIVDHGLVENGIIWKITILLEGPILNFHDYGEGQ